jgi:hypothetical protein
MEDLVALVREFVQTIQNHRGISHVAELYTENAESVEAAVPPGRELRIAKGRIAIQAKREVWAAAHEIQKLSADGPYVHPPNWFAVRFEVQVTQKETDRQMTLREIAMYTVEEGKIVREEFFMVPKQAVPKGGTARHLPTTASSNPYRVNGHPNVRQA